MNVIPNLAYNDPIDTDVLIIGSGAAGLMTAASLDPALSVTLASRGELYKGSTWHAQGGICCVSAPEDSMESHIEDTLKAGAGLCNTDAVRTLVESAPACIRTLSKVINFDCDADGNFRLGKEGAHSFRRILHAGGDATGKALHSGLTTLARRHPRLDCMEYCRALELLTDGERCTGALFWNLHQNRLQPVRARAVIVATGGYSKLFLETTNPATSTGDGIAIALRLGAVLQDMEFTQFHPTALFIAGAPRVLISEAVRGEGAVIKNAGGDEFLKNAHSMGELAPRDIVSRVIVNEMIQSGESCVFLDMTHMPADKLAKRFPGVHSVCHQFGVDPAKQWIPVRPAAHYTMGGIRTDLNGATNIPGLYACGEAASNGVHGANRLASNSLLETIVYGERCARAAESNLSGETKDGGMPDYEPANDVAVDLNVSDLLQTLKTLTWKHAGVFRRGEKLQKTLKRIHEMQHLQLRPETISEDWVDFRNLSILACPVVKGALEREESRGAHYRFDFPDTSETPVHSLFKKGDCGR